MSEEDIDKILEKWFRYKNELSELEKKVKKYRDIIEKHMDENSLNNLDTRKYTLSRINCLKSTISKKDVPDDLWNKYSKRSKYWMYSLKEKKV